jgi:signal peptidase I
MSDTLMRGDHILVTKYNYGYGNVSFPFGSFLKDRRLLYTQPKRGDIIVYRRTISNDTRDYIKRVIGIPGDTVQLKDGILYVNDVALKLDLINSYKADVDFYNETNHDGVKYLIRRSNDYYIKYNPQLYSINNTIRYVVPKDHFFVMGDNRNESHDSRFADMGFVSKNDLIGKFTMLLFSINYDEKSWISKFRGNRVLKFVT